MIARRYKAGNVFMKLSDVDWVREDLGAASRNTDVLATFCLPSPSKNLGDLYIFCCITN